MTVPRTLCSLQLSIGNLKEYLKGTAQSYFISYDLSDVYISADISFQMFAHDHLISRVKIGIYPMVQYSIFSDALVDGCWTGSETPAGSIPTTVRASNGKIIVRSHNFESDVTCKWIISV